MPNLAVVLKDEIARLARKEIRKQTATMQKASAQYRRDIAALKRTIAGLERKLAMQERIAGPMPTPKVDVPEPGVKLRFMAKGLRTHRKRLGLSAGDYAKLVGVTPQSIYNWERGVSKPRQAQIALLAAVRRMGKKNVAAKLAQISEAAPSKKTVAKKAAPKKTKKAAPTKKRAAKKKVAKKKAAPAKKATKKKTAKKAKKA